MDDKEDLSNDYDVIASYYDSLMCNGYYDYNAYCVSLLGHLTDQRSLLEIGIGTGLLAKEVLSRCSNLAITGIDISESMLKIARKRLGNEVELIHSDIMDFQPLELFDVVVSLGASFSFVGTPPSIQFLHSCESESQLGKMLHKISNFLRKDGRLFVNLQGKHKTESFNLPDQLVYEQEVFMLDENRFIKRYSFVNNGVTLAKMSGSKNLITADGAIEMFQSVGLASIDTPQKQSDFFVFSKK